MPTGVQKVNLNFLSKGTRKRDEQLGGLGESSAAIQETADGILGLDMADSSTLALAAPSDAEVAFGRRVRRDSVKERIAHLLENEGLEDTKQSWTKCWTLYVNILLGHEVVHMDEHLDPPLKQIFNACQVCGDGIIDVNDFELKWLEAFGLRPHKEELNLKFLSKEMQLGEEGHRVRHTRKYTGLTYAAYEDLVMKDLPRFSKADRAYQWSRPEGHRVRRAVHEGDKPLPKETVIKPSKTQEMQYFVEGK
mmetsp:Transcript_22304/g.69400  ORF Transcript_22304/g.69400 Transcript_22304/m.69400 type:complete len:250 (+) Transcript_22304:219-968(+)